MQKVLIHFTKKNNLSSYLIRFLTFSNFSHIEVEVDGFCYSAKFWEGVYKRTKEDFEKDEKYIETWSTSVSATQKEELIKVLDSEVYKRYDILAVLNLGIFRRNWEENDKKWFCSELIDFAFKKISRALTNKRVCSSRITPKDLRFSTKLQYVQTKINGINLEDSFQANFHIERKNNDNENIV